ncbi:hypothetical protein BDW02DRAFT_651048 [Decorospora gaudefroyi]|uniref:Uncharacterized protein n=1 Tax=Decorospora gaudefroyi TaxID=184978 RepID=A0A6A5K5W7_9PLEO|nr:hypothetical protein BDW02DRAFT_651048 [Decorospora gaudefroyi]
MATLAGLDTENSQLLAKCIEALKEEYSIKLQLEALPIKINKLRRRGRILDTKRRDNQTETSDLFLAYAKKGCLEFCRKVHQTFPREIRDVIYSYITGCQYVAIRSELKAWNHYNYFSSSHEAQLQHASESVDEDHWWNKDFVGAEMRREIGENYYRISCFEFGDEFENIPRFRVTDQWKLGFLPVDFVQKVEVSVTCDGSSFKRMDEAREQELPTDWGWDGYERGIILSTTTLMAHLELLFGFRPGTAISIKLKLDPYQEMSAFERQEFACENLVPLIFPTLQRLKNNGFKVRFILHASNSIPGTYHPNERNFTSAWCPRSVDELANDFFEYVEEQKKQDQRIALWEQEDELFGYE